MSGDVSLAADVMLPNTNGFGDRKAILVVRQDLDDDSMEAVTALHGAGWMHLAQRPAKNAQMKQSQRLNGQRPHPGEPPVRIGLEKHGDDFAFYVSTNREPMHQVGTNMTLHIEAPFYVGIGFCSHVPDKIDTGVLANVVLENAAGKVH